MADRNAEVAKKKKISPSSNGHSEDREKEMSFLDHLEELRWHIIRSLVAIVVVGIVLYIFHKWLFDYVIFGPTHDNFISYGWMCQMSHYLGMGEAMCFKPPPFQKIATDFAETFIISIKVSFIGGFVVAFPYVFKEMWSFVRPGLYENERSATRGIIFICSFLFMLGVLFGYFVIAPFAVNFLGGYEIPGVTNSPTLKSFVNYMVMFTLPAGLIFELPIVVYFLAKVGIVTPEGMKKYRKHSFIGILMLAAILTPPDVVTQFLIGIPLYILYEVSILVAARVAKQDEEYFNGGPQPKSKGKLFGKWRKTFDKKNAPVQQKQKKEEVQSIVKEEQEPSLIEAFEDRDLSQYTFLALSINRQQISGRSAVVVSGVNDMGRQLILGIVPELGSGKYGTLRDRIIGLKNRGFKYRNGLICVLDKVQSWRTIIVDTFGEDALIQVNTDHLIRELSANMEMQGDAHPELQEQLKEAFEERNYETAYDQIDRVYEELRVTDPTSAEILKEGMSEALLVKQLSPEGAFAEDFVSRSITEQLEIRMPKGMMEGAQKFDVDKFYRQIVVAINDFETTGPVVENADRLIGLIAAIENMVEKRRGD